MKPALPYVKAFPDRHGKMRHYYRRKGWPSTPLPDPLKDMQAFLNAYAAAEGKVAPRNAAGTLGALITEYLKAPEFRDRKPASRELYLYVIKWLRSRPSIDLPVASITRLQIIKMRNELAEDTPGKANMVLKVFKRLMAYAVDIEWRTDNPSLRIPGVKGGEYRSWTDAELMQFEERWPRRTTERLIYELALGTGQRRGDIAKMTWADVSDEGINVVQEKTGTKLWIPCHVSLGDELAKSPKGHAVIVATRRGQSFTSDYMGVVFSRAIMAAELSDECVLHGLRKAAARRLAEAGCTERQIMSITGHKSAKEVDRYTRQADQKVQAKAAILKLTRNT